MVAALVLCASALVLRPPHFEGYAVVMAAMMFAQGLQTAVFMAIRPKPARLGWRSRPLWEYSGRERRSAD